MRKTIAVIVGLLAFLAIATSAHADDWTLKFEQNFNTNAHTLGSWESTYGTKFDNYDGYPDTSQNGTYNTDKTLTVHDGVLDIWLNSTYENSQWNHWVAAIIPKWPCPSGSPGRFQDDYGNWVCHGIQYGYVEYVASFDEGLEGYKTAWLLWPNSEQWPDDGEIDFPESCTDLTGDICFATHAAQSDPDAVHFVNTGVSYLDTYTGHPTWGSYHKFGTLWMQDRVEYYLDDVHVGTTWAEPGYPVPSEYMRAVIQTETETGQQPAPPNSVAGSIFLDYVQVWDYDYPVQQRQARRGSRALKSSLPSRRASHNRTHPIAALTAR